MNLTTQDVMAPINKAARRVTDSWEMVTLGLAASWSHFCLCCLTFNGTGMARNGRSYCMECWMIRQAGHLCDHAPNGGLSA
ncbi:MAG TPA: hypothetical protein VK009_25840 [Chloroflexota bacterium]|nr:hypothetical protein [Chloroflexota bacterium]